MVTPVRGFFVPPDRWGQFHLYAGVHGQVHGISGVLAFEALGDVVEVDDDAVSIVEVAAEVVAEVMGQLTVLAAQQDVEEAIVSAVAMDRDDGVDAFDEGGQGVGVSGVELGTRDVLAKR